ncbi:hypothetical protein G3I42_19700 [Streptomyces sp. SID11385]|nr:hypothetical protein [Streptomyces sp. SID11385]
MLLPRREALAELTALRPPPARPVAASPTGGGGEARTPRPPRQGDPVRAVYLLAMIWPLVVVLILILR